MYRSMRSMQSALAFRTGLARPASSLKQASVRPFGRTFVRGKSSSAAAWAGRTAGAIRRGASFGFYTAVVAGGLGILGVTGYFLAQELILPSSDGMLFHKAFNLIEKDARSAELLGTHLKGHGESTNQRNVKSRPIASTRGTDRFGREHVLMQFHVDGSKSSGLARLEAVTDPRTNEIDFRYLVLEVPGHAKHYLINKEVKPKRSGGLFGIHWGPKK